MTSTKEFFDKLSETNRATMRELQDTIESQKELWQKVPYLALQADWNPKPSQKLLTAYTTGFWSVASAYDAKIFPREHLAYVDCETGRLHQKINGRPYIDPYLLIPMSLSLQDLDAESVILRLQQTISNKFKNPYTKTEMSDEFVSTRDAWKKALAKELELEEIYQRKE